MTTVDERPVARERAPHLSPEAAPWTPARAGEYLTFSLGRESCAVAIECVQEIRGYAESTRIAGGAACVKGVTDLRGTMVPVIDLRILAGIAEAVHDGVTATIVLDLGRRLIGIVVDAVADVQRVDAAAIKAVPQLGALRAGMRIAGIATQGEGDSARLLLLLDVARMLADAGLDDAALQAR